jgi:hypothetical protein
MMVLFVTDGGMRLLVSPVVSSLLVSVTASLFASVGHKKIRNRTSSTTTASPRIHAVELLP